MPGVRDFCKNSPVMAHSYFQHSQQLPPWLQPPGYPSCPVTGPHRSTVWLQLSTGQHRAGGRVQEQWEHSCSHAGRCWHTCSGLVGSKQTPSFVGELSCMTKVVIDRWGGTSLMGSSDFHGPRKEDLFPRSLVCVGRAIMT